MITDQTVLKLSSDIIFRAMGEGDGAVIVEAKTGQLYSCNDTTTAFLEAIDGTRTFKQIVDQLNRLFDVDRAVLEGDLKVLTADLHNSGLVVTS